MLQQLDSCMTELDEFVSAKSESVPPTVVTLPEANWSVARPVTGRIRLIPAGKDVRDLMSFRAGDAERVIYLMDSKATVIELAMWPDKNSYVVSAGGGRNSEEMNFAMSEGRPYVNGARRYFEVLKRLIGKHVILLPYDAAPAARGKGAAISTGSYLLVDDDSLSPAGYINRVVQHPTNREMAYAFMAWCLEGSTSGSAAYAELKGLVSARQYKNHVKEGRNISPKDYPRGYKLRTLGEFIRALARFAAAREEKNLDYAKTVANTFPYAPLARTLKKTLADDKRGR
jgi:hypothetical protein